MEKIIYRSPSVENNFASSLEEQMDEIEHLRLDSELRDSKQLNVLKAMLQKEIHLKSDP